MLQEDRSHQLQETQHLAGMQQLQIVWDLNKGSGHRREEPLTCRKEVSKVIQDGEAFVRNGKDEGE